MTATMELNRQAFLDRLRNRGVQFVECNWYPYALVPDDSGRRFSPIYPDGRIGNAAYEVTLTFLESDVGETLPSDALDSPCIYLDEHLIGAAELIE